MKTLILALFIFIALNSLVLSQLESVTFKSSSDGSLIAFTSSNLPIVVINTNGQVIPNDIKITADMGVIYNGEGIRNNLTDPL